MSPAAFTREEIAIAQRVINCIARMADALSAEAGVGGCESAGHLVSYLNRYPRDTELCLQFGILELPMDWIVKGSLTYVAGNGKIMHPDQAARARTIKKLEKGTPA